MSPLISENTDVARITANGQTIVTGGSPLTRLNYFDGKFLRADDLKREQNYLRQLIQFSNQGLGAGVVYGLDTVLDKQGRLSIGAGLAMDSVGRTLLVGSNATLDIAALMDASRSTTPRTKPNSATVAVANSEFSDCVDLSSRPGDSVGAAGSLYVICIGHAESLCGNEDVYGRLCEDACVTATDRPLIVEGVVVRALPLTLRTPLATSKAVPLVRTHLRSLVASAYFEDERHIVESLISRAGLSLDTWCVGAELTAVGCVPLAVVGRAGTMTTFLDAWTVRRERMEAPAKRYWAWRMAMRPWDVYLAHILQFQCQLHDVLEGATDDGQHTPCAPQQQALQEASQYLRDFSDSYARHVDALSRTNVTPDAYNSPDAVFRLQGGAADLDKLRASVDGALRSVLAGPRSRVLINGGMIELPSAGYLPVVPGTMSVNEQMRRLLGDGVDLRFCIVRPDFVPHALEEAQHMERISLLTGLDNPQAKPEVDILVPNGELLASAAPSIAGFDTQVRIVPKLLGGSDAPRGISMVGENVSGSDGAVVVHGAGRADTTNGMSFHFAGATEVPSDAPVVDIADRMKEFVGGSARKRETMLRAAMRTAATPAPVARQAMPDGAMMSRIAMNPNFAASPNAAPSNAAPSNAAPPNAAPPNAAPPNAAPPNAAPLSAGTVPAEAALYVRRPVVGAWTTVRTERDPFSLQVAESSPMNMEFALTSQSVRADGSVTHTLLRIRAFATLTVTQAALTSGAGTRLAAHVSGTYTIQTLAGSIAPSDTSRPFDVDINLRRTGTAASGTMRALVGGTDSDFQWLGEASWGGTPLEATFKLSILPGDKVRKTDGPDVMEIISLSALASNTALSEGNPLRVLSTAALERLGDELSRTKQNGPAFVDGAERLLFPPAPAAVDNATVQPTLDWVLFHRRRTQRCAADTQQPAPTPSRRYQLFTIRVGSTREADAVRKTLNAGGQIRSALQPVDVVEFASGAATLVTATGALLSDWGAMQPGNTLLYAAAATGIPADAALTGPRLSRVVQSLASVTPLDPDTGALDVLPGVPPEFADSGSDGIIVLVTVDVDRLTYQNVYRVMLDEKVRRALRQNQLDQLLKMSQAIVDLGVVPFAGSDTALTVSTKELLNQTWTKAGGGVPASVTVYAKPDDTSVGDDATLVARGRAIGDAVRGEAGASADTAVEKHDIEGAWPVGPTSPVITIVSVEPSVT